MWTYGPRRECMDRGGYRESSRIKNVAREAEKSWLPSSFFAALEHNFLPTAIASLTCSLPSAYSLAGWLISLTSCHSLEIIFGALSSHLSDLLTAIIPSLTLSLSLRFVDSLVLMADQCCCLKSHNPVLSSVDYTISSARE